MVSAVLGLFLLLSGIAVLALLPKVAALQRPILRGFGAFQVITGIAVVVLALLLRWP
jgi:hypothetical protein